MKPRELSIKRKIMTVTMLTSVVVLAVTVAAFMAYDLVSYRESTRHSWTRIRPDHR